MNILDKTEAIADDLKRYFATNVELLKFEALDKSSALGAGVVSRVIIWTTAIFALLFLSTWAALYLSTILGAYYLGFGIVGGFYFLVFLILLIARKSLLESPIRNKIISGTGMLEEEDKREGDSEKY